MPLLFLSLEHGSLDKLHVQLPTLILAAATILSLAIKILQRSRIVFVDGELGREVAVVER